ncbi:MAG: LCP family protein [Spirochaetes bacterium]|nr:LCP family protein [Spirochaetota bacterium]
MRKDHRTAAIIVTALGIVFAVLSFYYFFFISPISTAQKKRDAVYFSFVFTSARHTPYAAFIGAYAPATGRTGMVSIPSFMGLWRGDSPQLNTLEAWYTRGGYRSVFDAISRTFRMPLTYRIVVQERDLADIIDLMGGVRIFIENEVSYVREADGIHLAFSPGLHLLDGGRAVQYIAAAPDMSRERLSRLEDVVMNLCIGFAGDPSLKKVFTTLPFTMTLAARLHGNLRPVDYRAFGDTATNLLPAGFSIGTMSGEPTSSSNMLAPLLNGRHAVKSAKDIARDVLMPLDITPYGKQDIKLAVRNATIIGGLADRIKIRMSYRGFSATEFGNAGIHCPNTFVLIRNGSAAKGFMVADAAKTKLVYACTDRSLLQDAALVLGDDYYEIPRIQSGK